MILEAEKKPFLQKVNGPNGKEKNDVIENKLVADITYFNKKLSIMGEMTFGICFEIIWEVGKR